MTFEDAEKSIPAGVWRVIVTTHGGQQLDGATATIDALPNIARQMAGRVARQAAGRATILLDREVRGGTDGFKAPAPGACVVPGGRQHLWGLAAAGETGVRRVLEMFRAELELATAVAGCPTLGAITRSLVPTHR